MTASAVVQVVAAVVAVGVTVAAVVLLVRSVRGMLAVIGLGQPDHGRLDALPARLRQLLRETVGHTRMFRRGLVGAAHWLVFAGFILLLPTLVAAYGQLADAHFALPLVGGWAAYRLATELLAVTTLLGILVLIGIRQRAHPRRAARDGRASRFYGSNFWQAYYVEATIVAVSVCILSLHGLEGALAAQAGDTGGPSSAVQPVGAALAAWWQGASPATLAGWVHVVAAAKITVSMAWLLVIAANPTMGVAWHRFTAFANILLKRHPDDRPALGALPPVMSGGQPVDFEDPGEDDLLGIGKVEDFTWKGLLDFTTCTECGRCQSVCPAWTTEKPLSPKLLITTLRDHAYAKAPTLLAPTTSTGDGRGNGDHGDRGSGSGSGTGGSGGAAAAHPVVAGPGAAVAESARPLVAVAEAGGVIDPDVLWACTMCGACVQECPVDIEHVDHIAGMRRHQVLMEAEFPNELSGMFRNLEQRSNPWGLPARQRMDWASDLPFEVPVLGEDVADAGQLDYLFWVGCAGAFDDRAKQTTRAVAELLHTAGVSFAVLGRAEACTGDPARRSGNEFVYQMLAQGNLATLAEHEVTRVVVTCPHCLTTIGSEYAQLGGTFEVVHHTELLQRLVAEGRLVPRTPVDGKVTFHDPCYLGRHNQVYQPPREVLGAVPGLELAEMPRNRSRSFCCGAGGGRMWMEENIGRRINTERVGEALQLAPDTVAVGCPFCKVMLGDGVTGAQEEAAAGVEVADVAQVLLRSVRPADGSGASPGRSAGPGSSSGVGAPQNEPGSGSATGARPDEPGSG